MLGSFGIYCFVFPWAMLLLSFDWMPFGMEWMSSLLLAMLGLSAAGWLWSNYSRAGLFVGACIFVLGVALEYAGVLTGFPFGPYRYTGVLIPELPGGVPFAIGFAWLLVIVGGLFTARWLLPTSGRHATSALLLSLLGAALAVGLDLLLEPVASHIKSYWTWLAGDGDYYGIPWSNFGAWFVAALAMNLIVAALLGLDKPLRWKWLPVALLGMNVVLFGVVNVAHGYFIAGAIGLAMLGLLLAGWIRQNNVARIPE
ncbi:MAG: carotenoid biosynthesis protein [Chloroflexota bacterium]